MNLAVIHSVIVISIIDFVLKDVLKLLHIINLRIMVSSQSLVVFVGIVQERALWDRESLFIVRRLDAFILLINFIPLIMQL